MTTTRHRFQPGWVRHALKLFCTTLCTILILLVQDAAADEKTGAAQTTPPATAEAANALPTVDELTKFRESAAADATLDDATKATLDQHFAKAIEHLQAAEAARATSQKLTAEMQSAPDDIVRLQRGIESPVRLPASPESVESIDSLPDLEALLSATNTALEAARQRLKVANDEIDQRSKRRPQLSDLKTQNSTQNAELETQMAAPDPEGERPEVRTARQVRYRARQLRLQQEATLYDQELKSYDTTTREGPARRWALERDLADRETQELDKLRQKLEERLAILKQKQAEKEARDAQRAAMEADPAIRREAELNAELARRNADLLLGSEETRKKLADREAELKLRIDGFTELKKRAEASEFSPAVGVLLRNQQAALPNPDRLRASSGDRQSRITSLNIEIVDWESKRRRLFMDLDAEVQQLYDSAQSQSEDLGFNLEAEIRRLLTNRLNAWQELIDNGTAELDQLVRLDTQEKLLAEQIETESLWLAEHVLWVRSASWVGSESIDYVGGFRTVLQAQEWKTALELVADYLRSNVLWFSCVVAALILVFAVRRRLKTRIRLYGEQARKSTTIAFLPTVTSLLLTLLIAWPASIILVLVAQRIDANTAGNMFAHALARGCGVCAILWGIIETLRMSAQIDGVGEAHFDWGRKVTRSVRRFAHLLALTYLPLAFISHFCEALEDEVVSGSVGRLAFIARMAALTWAFSRLLNSASPIMQTVAGSNPVSLFRRTCWLWPHVLIYSPLVLILISASGYHYTAIQLFVRFTVTILAAFSLFLLSELVSRWLLISYRRLAIQRARAQRIQQQQAAAAAEGGAQERPAPAPASMGLNLTDINAQARQIIRIGGSILTVAALYLIWVDVLPALGILDNVQVWPNTLIATGDETQVVWITASDLLLAGIIAVLTLVASRNVPGLMEMMFLSRLPLDAGARYAATTVSRYVILVTGFLIGFRQMGIGWSSVQWLVAAMSVGLGFGLQEIFANFVSGIILLFERPIRVGDTITIGEFSGNVARIRIRATTIIDWDQKDVIIPNRELVTGKLVNWTLSNASLRIIIPVGIAYGSDTRLVTELLRSVADEHPAILTDPAPQVIFSSFGDNSLLFELRVYVSGLSLVLSARHELHLAIDDLFRKHQIEISFPQRDLHVRSVPQELITAVQRAAKDKSDSDRDAA